MSRDLPIPSLLAILLIFTHDVNSANILIYHNIASYSHRAVTYPLADALAKKGHQVTYISPYYPKGEINPKIKEIIPKKVVKTVKDALEADFDITVRASKLLPSLVNSIFPLATSGCEALLASPELEEYLKQTHNLDLVILDNCLSECGAALAYKYSAKIVYFSTTTHLACSADFFGYPGESSAIPEMGIEPVQVPLSFWGRLVNTLASIHFRYAHYSYMKVIDGMVRKSLDLPLMPFLDDVARNASLILYTGDVITDYARSQPPLVVNVAGLHLKKETKPIPDHIDKFIQSTITKEDNDGFVYISLGSFISVQNLPERVKQVFFQTMENFPHLKFFWKWGGKEPKNIPENLYLQKWFPQQDLLAHPKICAFITQSGRASTIEAVFNAVPMIAFPVIADQDNNANRMNEMGANIIMELGSVTHDQLKSAIQTVVYNASVKARMVRLQKILIDQPMQPLDKAVWWTEYVLRHPNTDHLKPTGCHQTWYQRRLLDVWLFIFGIISLAGIILAKLLSCVGRRLSRKSSKKVQISTKSRKGKKA